MSLINFGAGLASMGQSIAETAGAAGLTQQKADLEQQRDILASQLAEGRETRLESMRQSGASKLSAQQSGERTQEYQANKQFDLQQLPAVAKAQDDITKMQASDPAYVKALRTMTDAKASPEQRAAAGLYTVQARGAVIANKAAQDLLDARDAMKTAEASGNPDQMKAAEGQMYIAQYSMHDEVQRAAALTQQETDARLNMQSIQQQISAHMVSPLGELPEAKAQRTSLVKQLQDELDVAQDNYRTAQAMASKAAQSIPSFSPPGQASGGMINRGATRPPLSSFINPPSGGSPPAPTTP